MPELTGLLVAGRRRTDPAVTAAIAARLEAACTEVYAGPGVEAGGASPITVQGGASSRLAVIVAALERASTPLVAVVGAELTRADPRVLTALAGRWRGEAAVVPVVGGRVRPLHGIYATTAADRLREVLDEGTRSVMHALSAVGASVVGDEVWGQMDEEGSFAVPPS